MRKTGKINFFKLLCRCLLIVTLLAQSSEGLAHRLLEEPINGSNDSLIPEKPQSSFSQSSIAKMLLAAVCLNYAYHAIVSNLEEKRAGLQKFALTNLQKNANSFFLKDLVRPSVHTLVDKHFFSKGARYFIKTSLMIAFTTGIVMTVAHLINSFQSGPYASLAEKVDNINLIVENNAELIANLPPGKSTRREESVPAPVPAPSWDILKLFKTK